MAFTPCWILKWYTLRDDRKHCHQTEVKEDTILCVKWVQSYQIQLYRCQTIDKSLNVTTKRPLAEFKFNIACFTLMKTIKSHLCQITKYFRRNKRWTYFFPYQANNSSSRCLSSLNPSALDSLNKLVFSKQEFRGSVLHFSYRIKQIFLCCWMEAGSPLLAGPEGPGCPFDHFSLSSVQNLWLAQRVRRGKIFN